MERTKKLVQKTLDKIPDKEFVDIVEDTLIKKLSELCAIEIMKDGPTYGFEKWSDEIKQDLSDLSKEFLQIKGLDLKNGG